MAVLGNLQAEIVVLFQPPAPPLLMTPLPQIPTKIIPICGQLVVSNLCSCLLGLSVIPHGRIYL